MSIPPQIIRVKRKRADETPVTFLQFDHGSSKRHRGESWAYQRRDALSHNSVKFVQPVIHVSSPSAGKKRKQIQQSSKTENPSCDARGPFKPRQFHISRSATAQQGRQSLNGNVISQDNRFRATVFVESLQEGKSSHVTQQSLAARQHRHPIEQGDDATEPSSQMSIVEEESKQYKPPSVLKKAPYASVPPQDTPASCPLADSHMSRHSDDMQKMTDVMNQWVLDEIGAGLQTLQQETKPTRLKPKSPSKRIHERHPELVPPKAPSTDTDMVMNDDSDSCRDDIDWVIEEYVRIPATSVATDAPASDVGVLVLDEDKESILFFGSPEDDDDDALTDDQEDENTENYYAADYPEDEVDTDDEYGRQAYLFRHGNNSDDEYDEDCDSALEDENDDTAAASIARMRAFLKRTSAFDAP